jgi:predicted esterase
VRLAYLDRPIGPTGPTVVVLHHEGATPADEATRVADRLPGTGRVILPFGDYAYYPSGMEIGGLCWYRVLPGFEGTDPISLTKAVVQVGDLLGDLGLERPVLTGSGQGAVVALGAGLLAGRAGSSVVCVDAPVAHLALLPDSLLAADPPPRVLLLAGGPAADDDLGRMRDLLGAKGLPADTRAVPGSDSRGETDRAMADEAARWLPGD